MKPQRLSVLDPTAVEIGPCLHSLQYRRTNDAKLSPSLRALHMLTNVLHFHIFSMSASLFGRVGHSKPVYSLRALCMKDLLPQLMTFCNRPPWRHREFTARRNPRSLLWGNDGVWFNVYISLGMIKNQHAQSDVDAESRVLCPYQTCEQNLFYGFCAFRFHFVLAP